MKNTFLRALVLVGLLALNLILTSRAGAHSLGGSGVHWNTYGTPTIKVLNTTSAPNWILAENTLDQWDGYTILSLPRTSGGDWNIHIYDGNYGDTGWGGLAPYQVDYNNHITTGDSILNTYYGGDNYWKHGVFCQELGHNFGLDHSNDGGCMGLGYFNSNGYGIVQHNMDDIYTTYAHNHHITISPYVSGFVRAGTSNEIYHRTYQHGAWQPLTSIGFPSGGAASDPTVTSWAPGRQDVFVRGSNGSLWHQAFDGGMWYGWTDLGGSIVGSPDAASWGPGHFDSYVRGVDNQIWHRAYWNGWIPWLAIGAPPVGLTSDPSVASWTSGRLDVFVRGGNGSLWHRWYQDGTWYGWSDLGGGLIGGPDATSMQAGHLDVYVRGTDNNIWHRGYWNGWSPWISIGAPPGGAMSDPSVTSWGPGRIDVFVRGATGTLWHQAYQDGVWYGWEDLGNRLTGGPDSTSWLTSTYSEGHTK